MRLFAGTLVALAALVALSSAAGNDLESESYRGREEIIEELAEINRLGNQKVNCNLKILNTLIEAHNKLKPDIDASSSTAILYFSKCFAVFDEMLLNYLDIMGVIGECTLTWFDAVDDMFNLRTTYLTADSAIRKTKNFRKTVRFGAFLSRLSSELPDEESQLNLKQRIIFDSYNYGEGLCFYALQPPLGYAYEFTQRFLETFNLTEIKRILERGMMASGVNYANMYFLQIICQNLRDTAQNSNRKPIYPRYGLKTMRDYEMLHMVEKTIFNSPVPLDCSLTDVYKIKWAWRVFDKNPSLFQSYLSKFGLISEELVKKCLAQFGKLPWPEPNLNQQRPATSLEVINSWRNLVHAHLTTTAAENVALAEALYPRITLSVTYDKTSMYETLLFDSTASVSTTNTGAADEAQLFEVWNNSLRYEAFMFGRGLCDYYLIELGIYTGQNSELAEALAILEQLASNKNLRVEIYSADEFLKHFELFFVCRSLRIAPLDPELQITENKEKEDKHEKQEKVIDVDDDDDDDDENADHENTELDLTLSLNRPGKSAKRAWASSSRADGKRRCQD